MLSELSQDGLEASKRPMLRPHPWQRSSPEQIGQPPEHSEEVVHAVMQLALVPLSEY
jgi:hypothetical protein